MGILLIMLMAHGSSLYCVGTGNNYISNTAFVGDSGTIAIWEKRTSQTSIITLFSNTSGTVEYYIGTDNTAYGRFSGNLQSFGTYLGALNKWEHFVIKFFGDTNKATVYVNGDSFGTATFTGTTSLGTGLYFGNKSGTSRNMVGYLGSLMYFRHRYLSASEIKWLYNHPDKTYSTDSLSIYWKCNEYTGTVAGDSSGNANNGTISGATWNLDTPVFGAKCEKQ